MSLRAPGAGAVPVQATSVDLEVVRALELMLSQRRPVVLVLPQAGQVLVTLAAVHAVAVLAAGRSRGRLAAVTRRLGGRERYDQLQVEQAALTSVLPRCSWLRRASPAAGLPAADRSTAGEACGHPSCLAVLPDATGLQAARLTELRGVLLDLDVVAPADLTRLLTESAQRPYFDPLAVVCVTGNPLDSAAIGQVTAAGGQVLALDQPSLAALARTAAAQPASGRQPMTGGPAAGSRDGSGDRSAAQPLLWPEAELQALCSSELRIVEIDDAPTDCALAAAWSALARLARSSGPTMESELRRAWGLLASLGALPVSVARHDRHRAPGPWSPPALQDSLDRLSAVTQARPEPEWTALAQALHAAALAARAERKAAAVLRAAASLQASGASGGSMLVVVPGRAAAAALTAALAESTVDVDLNRVHVSGVRDLQTGRAPVRDVALTMLCGPLLRRHSGLLSVPGPTACTLLAAGPHQGLRAADQALAARAAARSLAQQARNARLSSVGVTPLVPRLLLDRPRPAGTGGAPGTVGHALESGYGVWAEGARAELASRVIAAVPGAVDLTEEQLAWSPFGSGVLDHLGDAAGSLEPADTAGPGQAGAASEVLALPVAVLPLDGGPPQLLALEPLAPVARRDPAGVAHVAARALRPDDLIAVIDGLGRRSLFDVATRRLAELPDWQLPVALAALWRQCASRVLREGESHEALRQRLGTQVVAGTVGTWVRGQVAGPDDPADLRRVAEAAGDQALLSRQAAVWQALQAIRRAHRALGRWLSVQMEQAAKQGLGDDALRGRRASGVADAELGIDVADLLDGVQVLRVLAVGDAQLFPSGQVGRLQPLPASAIAR